MLEIIDGTPLADTIQQARQAMARGHYQSAADHYQQVLRLASDSQSRELRKALWIEHIGGLIQCEQFSLAAAQAEIYITMAQSFHSKQAEVELHVLLAESMAAQGNWFKCESILNVIASYLEMQTGEVEQLGERTPQFIRLWGLLAAEKGDFIQGHRLLQEAARRFADLNNQPGQRAVINDLRRLAFDSGNANVLDEILQQNVQTTSETLLFARALRRHARYETAARLLDQWRNTRDIEPALRFPLLHELALLYQLLADQRSLQQLLPLLEATASTAPDPDEASAAVARLTQWHAKGFTINSGFSFEARLSTVRALIQNHDLAQAEAQLLQLRPEANTPRFAAYWSLVAGELEFAIGLAAGLSQVTDQARQALAHLQRAAEIAEESSLLEVYSQAIHLIGQVHYYLRDDIEQASEYWFKASQADETIAHRQETDQARIRYLEVLQTRHDELIDATAAKAGLFREEITSEIEAGPAERSIPKGELLASVIVALETARGAAILSKIFPSGTKMRHLPSPNQPEECLRWYAQISKRLPKDLAIWIMHDTSGRLHHGIAGKNLLHWANVEIDRYELNEKIETLKDCWRFGSESLENLVEREPETMNNLLIDIARTLRLDLALTNLPQHITRIAIVAGNALGEIPFAALPLPGTEKSPQPLITRFALSDLPCISARHPLLQRASISRGQDTLRVRPPAADLFNADNKFLLKKYQSLEGQAATIPQLGITLEANQFNLVRFDCHGKYKDDSGDALDSWLELASTPTDEGHLTANRFQTLSFNHCGTLILGACESGMSQRRGRDERLGFVRAGLVAGASSVLASRWVAAHLVAESILNRFQHYLTHLSKDQALQQAQLDIFQGRCLELEGTNIPNINHPARWACWSLYGDAGLQTDSSWPIRAFHRLWHNWKIR